MFKKETKLGDILLNEDVIYRIVAEAVTAVKARRRSSIIAGST